MEGQATVYFVGTAGAGKSTLIAAYDRWCKQHGITTLLVNLDPGAEKLPYEPDVDIRDTIRVSDIMEEHDLGPNGAQIAAADMIALDLDGLRDEIGSYRADQVLIDTPGQIELFVFRQSGKLIVENLAASGNVVLYLMDPYLSRTASGYASQLMLAATTHFRFQEPLGFVLSKKDVVDEESLETLRAWTVDPEALENDILGESPGMAREFAAQMTRLFEAMGHEQTLVPVSAGGDGIDDLYAYIQQVVGQAEESTPEYDTFLGQGQEEPN